MRTGKVWAMSAALLLVAGGCGARLTKAEMAAVDGTGSGTVSPGVAQGGSGSGGPVAGGSAPLLSSGRGGNRAIRASSATTAVGGSGAGSPTATGSGPAGSGGPGANGPAAPAVQPNNPLAGPGGKVCPAGAAGSGPGVTASTITIGNISTINGPVPGLFAGARYGTQAVADYINSLGGLCGRRVVVDAVDDQFDQATDQNEASAMASKVLSFVGSFSLQDSGIPDGAPGVPDLGEALTATRFKASTNYSPQPNPPGFTTGPYQFLKSDPRFASATQHMAILVENTPQTAVEGQYLEHALQSAGYHFAFSDFNLQPTDPTFNGDVPRMKQDGVTGVVFEATGAIIGQLANAMYAAGMKILLGNYCAAAYDPAYLQNAGPGSAGTLLSQSLALYDGEDAASVPMVATLDQWYSRVNPGQVPDVYGVYGWMSGLMLAQAINTGGAPTRSALLAGLRRLTSFTGGGLAAPGNPVAKTPPSCWLLIAVQNGRFVRDPSTPSGFRCSPAGYYHSS